MPVINLNPWSYTYIQQVAEEASYLAMQQQLRPALAREVVKTYRHSHRFNIPFLGGYVHPEWQRIDEIIDPVFLDITGRALPGESNAITAFEFFKRAQEHTKTESSINLGYGVIEMGQTQVLIATYKTRT